MTDGSKMKARAKRLERLRYAIVAILHPVLFSCLRILCHSPFRPLPSVIRYPLSVILLFFCLLPSAFSETLSLADCLRETAAANPSIVEEQIAILQAQGEKLVLRSRALPTLTVGGIAGYQGAQTSQTLRVKGVSTTVARNSTAIAVATGQLTQPIFDASVPASWRLGTIGVTAAQQNFYSIATAQLFRARTLFDRALYLQQREELLRQTGKLLDTGLQAQNALVNAGLGGRQGVLTAQVQRANFDPQLTQNGGSFHTTLATLLQVMGRHLPEAAPGKADPLDGITLSGSLEDGPLEFDPAEAAREALDQRPDLQALRTSMRSYAENANVARGERFPVIKIYLAGQYLPQAYVQSQNASSRASDRVQTTEIRPGIRGDWDIIDTGTILGQTRQFAALREVVGQSLRRMEQEIPGGLATLHGQAASAREALSVLRGSVATSQDTLNIIQAGVAQGVNSQLEFLDAQNGVYQTRLGVLESQLALSQAHAEFDRLTGRYLRYVPAATPSHPTASNRK